MSCDLRVSRIGLPARLVAPCPNPIEVDVINAGADPAELPFDVVLDFPGAAEGRQPARRYVQTVSRRESRWLMPGQTVTLVFNAALPCNAQTSVRATADASRIVPDNDRTRPALTVAAAVDLLPWIQSRLRVGLENAARVVTWSPPALCPGAKALVEVVFRNRGCAPTPSGFSVQLDAFGQSWVNAVPKLAAGASIPIVFDVTLPIAPGPITFAINPNVSFPQCSTTGLARSVTIPMQPGSAPRVDFSVDAPVVPGEAPSITWRLENDCDELGLVKARVSFAGTLLYESAQLATRLRAAVGESGVPIPLAAITPAIAVPFWTLGTRPLDLQLIATGAPGPLPAQAPLQVVAEPPSALAFTFTPRAGAAWKSSYLVGGRFTNASMFSAKTLVAVSLREHRSTDPTAAADRLVSLLASAFGTVVAGGTSPAVASFFRQDWQWVDPLSYLMSGTTRTYVYSSEYTYTDAFGNAYALQISAPFSVAVSVSQSKRDEALAALGAIVVFFSFLAMAATFTVVAIAMPYPANLVPTAIAGVCAAIAFGAWGIAIWRKALADDPPLPDFDYHERVILLPPPRAAFDPVVARRPTVANLTTLYELLRRVQGADEAMQRIHRKILGARVDGSVENLRLQREDFDHAWRSFDLSIAHLPDALAELAPALAADELFDQPLGETLRSWQRDGIPAEVEKQWAEAGHPQPALELAVTALRAAERLPDDLMGPLTEMVAGLTRVAHGRAVWVREVLALDPR